MTAKPGMTVLPPLVAFHAHRAMSLGLPFTGKEYGRQVRHVPSCCHPSTKSTDAGMLLLSWFGLLLSWFGLLLSWFGLLLRSSTVESKAHDSKYGPGCCHGRALKRGVA